MEAFADSVEYRRYWAQTSMLDCRQGVVTIGKQV